MYGASLDYYGLQPEVSPVYRILNLAIDDDDTPRRCTYRWNVFLQPLNCLFTQFTAKQIQLFHVYIYVDWHVE